MEPHLRLTLLLLLVGVLGLVERGGCVSKTSQHSKPILTSRVNGIFLYDSPLLDLSWVYTQEGARAYVQAHYTALGPGKSYDMDLSQPPDLLTLRYQQNLSTPEMRVDAINEAVADGYGWIVGTPASSFNTHFAALAPLYPSINFTLLGDPIDRSFPPNVHFIIPRVYQALYLEGALCAMITKTQKIGYLQSSNRSGLMNMISNSFLAGARHVNPNVTMLIGLVGPAPSIATKVGVKKLAEAGVDCLGHGLTSLAVLHAAQAEGVYAMGYGSVCRSVVGNRVAASVAVDSREHLIMQVDTMLGWSNDWGPNGLSPYGKARLIRSYSPLVPRHTRNAILKLEKDLLNGTSSQDEVLCDLAHYYPGPIVLFILSGCTLGFCVWAFVDMLLYRHTRAHQRSTPLFNSCILVGVVLQLVGALSMIGDPREGNCMPRFWLVGLGSTVVVVSILAKTWRLWRLSRMKSLDMAGFLSARFLLSTLFCVVTFQIIILVLWTTFRPVTPFSISNSDLYKFDEIEVACDWLNSPFIYPFCLLIASMVLPAILMTFQTQVVVGYSTEGGPAAIALYTNSILGVMTLGINYLVDHFRAKFNLSVFGIWLLATTTVSIFFLPKVVRDKGAEPFFELAPGEPLEDAPFD